MGAKGDTEAVEMLAVGVGMLTGVAGVQVHPVHASGEAITGRRVVVGDGGSGVTAEVAGFISGEHDGFGSFDAAGTDLDAVDEQGQ